MTTATHTNPPDRNYDAYKVKRAEIRESDLCSDCATSSPMSLSPKRDTSIPLPDSTVACRRCGVRVQARYA